jgi:hypothetical protein
LLLLYCLNNFRPFVLSSRAAISKAKERQGKAEGESESIAMPKASRFGRPHLRRRFRSQ